jgi:hypothetical protein
MRSNSDNKVFNNFTVHVKGVNVVEGKNMAVHAYMEYLDPDGDYVIFRYTQNPGEEAATTTLLAGTGKFKGITGGGQAKRITGGRPVAAGTTQFCNIHKGTFTVPK